MSLVVLIGVGLAGGVGAISRFLIDGAVAQRVRGTFPLGTFVVNVSGAFVLGALVGATLGADAFRLVGGGLIGAYTTFSTWAFESHRLGEDGELRIGGLNFVISLVVGLVAAWAGRKLGAAL
jgi:CrcB protein